MITPGGVYSEILDKWCDGVNNNENNYKPQIIDEEGDGATACNGSSGSFEQPLFGKPISKKTIYLTQEQVDYLKEEAVMDTHIGNFGYDAPAFVDKKDPTLNHKNMIKKSFEGE